MSKSKNTTLTLAITTIGNLLLENRISRQGPVETNRGGEGEAPAAMSSGSPDPAHLKRLPRSGQA